MEKQKISVIMSVFNAEKYLAEAAQSILNQTYANFEFIIIEDASTDRSLKILEEFEALDDRIILIKNKKNHGAQGFIKNLNLGLKIASGEYIARMDADDISDLNRFKKQIQFLTENPNIFIVGSNLQVIDREGKNLKILSAPEKDINIKKNMLKNMSLYHPVLLWRNNKKIFYREKMIACEDYDLYFRLMNDGYRLANIQEPLLQYRILENSISRKENKMVKWLFVEKARAFFLEHQQKGVDSYDDFEPENYLHILDLNYKNDVQDLLFAAKTALKYQNNEALTTILRKAKQYFPDDKRFNKYKWQLKIPKVMRKYFLKFNLK